MTSSKLANTIHYQQIVSRGIALYDKLNDCNEKYSIVLWLNDGKRIEISASGIFYLTASGHASKMTESGFVSAIMLNPLAHKKLLNQ